MSKSPITSHVLDTNSGFPAKGIPVTLYQQTDEGWSQLASAKTDDDGRVTDWLSADTELAFGTYKVSFELENYYQGESSFYPFADVVFTVSDKRHHHIPLLLSPFGYSTYRGS